MENRTYAADILVVDDSQANLIAIEAALGDLGGRVVRAQSGGEALRLLLERDFALVLLDVKMPSMDGFETARMIRARKRSRHTPIVFITAYGRDDREVNAAYALGAVDFLFKPIAPEVLRAKAAVFVELQARTAEVGRQAELIREHERREHERELDRERERWSAEAMRRQVEQLAEADRYKDRFLAMLGHELRNPLASITTGLELMRMTLDEHPEETSNIQLLRTQGILERQTRHLARLVDDLLDLARIRSGKIELRKSRVVLQDLLEQALHNSRPLIEAQQHELTMQLPDEIVELDGDSVRLVQVFSNLLNNAARYTPPKGRIVVRATRKDGATNGATNEETPDEIEIRVIDNGRGMSPDFLPHAFDAFRQESEQPDHGLGLGLALAQQIVALHDGSVTAHSKGMGHGSELVVRLPLGPPGEPRSVRVRKTTPPRTANRKLSIMLIDDSEDIRELMAELLRSWGHRVAVAADGESGVELTLQNRPDVAFVDIGLPLLDGYGVATRLRAEAGANVPRLIAMTGFGRDADKQRAHEVGFDQHIVKPASIEALKQALAFEDA
jgi:signal transduction histidine kinase